MYARSDLPISFPGLFGDWEINPSPVAINIGNGIYWYGIIICLGLLLAVLFCCKKAKQYGLTEDHVFDLIIWEIPLCIIGSRIYYVLFYLDLYRNLDGTLNWKKMIAIWDGGLAIYGTVIVSVIVLLIYCRCKKIPFGAFGDLGVMGLLIGQTVGRWGNFFNREAFGSETTLPWRMRLWTTPADFIEVHPTFLYESLWNLIGLLLIVFLISKARTFDGENTCFYFIWYGLGRFVIEGLRTDSLYFFGLELFGQPIRVSQMLSLVLVVVAFVVLIVNKRRYPSGRDHLYVTKVEALAAAEEEIAAVEGEEAAEETVESENAETVLAADSDGAQVEEVCEPAAETEEKAEN